MILEGLYITDISIVTVILLTGLVPATVEQFGVKCDFRYYVTSLYTLVLGLTDSLCAHVKMLWIRGINRQQRLVLKDSRDRYLSIPMSYHRKFNPSYDGTHCK
jgi:hypothetical protein